MHIERWEEMVQKGQIRELRRLKKLLLAPLVLMLAVLAFTAGSGIWHPAQANAATSNKVIVDASTLWQYRDDDTVPAEGWKTSALVTENVWKEATGSFGAKNGEIADLGGGNTPATLLEQYKQDGKTDIPVYYFRTTFDVEDPASISAITGSLTYDDAAVVYVNGVKIAGFDDASFDEQGYGGSNASSPKTADISFTNVSELNLKQTGNVVAIELHNGRASSSDVFLNLSKLTLVSGKADAEVKDVELAVGTNQTQRNFNWLSTSQQAAYVEVVKKPADYAEGDAFPTEGVVKVQSSQTSATRAGFVSNKATVKDIEANTTYLYRVGNDDAWSETAEFTSRAQGVGATFNFLFAGDPQVGASSASSDGVGWQNTLSRALQGLGGADFIISAGDQINSNGNENEYDLYYGATALSSLPQATTVGNHDNGSTRYTDYNNMPNVSGLGATANTGNQSGDYWYMYNGVLFMDLNSNNKSTAEHKQFMEYAIDANPNALWKIVVFHHSTFSLANHYTDSDIVQRRNELPQVFSDLGIDVVLMGHDHYFTRTYLMEGSNPVVPEGHDISKGEPAPTEAVNPQAGQVVYLTANSASGSKYYSLNGELSSAGLPGYVAAQDQSKRQSITNVTVSATSLTLDTYFTDTDTIQKLDTFTIKRTSAPQISVAGGSSSSVNVGASFDPMDGVSAVDSDGNDLTDQVVYTITNVDGVQVDAVDTSRAGSFVITYSVTDAYGESASFERTVTVVAKTSSESKEDGTSTTQTLETSQTSTSKGDLPQTGDESYASLASFVVLGLILVAVGAVRFAMNDKR